MATPPLKLHHLTIPLLFLIPTLLLTTHYLHSLPPTPTLTPHLSPSPHTFTFTIKLLTYNRLPSLTRCLTSLSRANYSSDTVHLHIYIDHFPNSSISSDVGQKLETWRKILEFVDGFEWVHGVKLVHYRTGNVGLQAQWLEAWWPVNDDDFVFVVEDDVVVSRFYYLFLKRVISGYYYNQTGYSPFVFGASLQRPRFVPGKHGNKMNLDSGTRLFLYPLVGTWGQLLFPKPWKEFRLWYDDHKAKGIKPLLEGMVTNGWYKKMGERIWTPWFIKFIHSRGYFNIYTNFPHETALSVSHRDAGVNYGKSIGPDSQLVENSRDIDLLTIQPLSNMKWYDFCFREVLPGRVAKELSGVSDILKTMEKQKPIILVGILEASEKTVRNLICHFERLNIRNYIFMAPYSKLELLGDLARRGHPVIDTQEVFNSVLSKMSSFELITDVIVKAYVTKKCLDSGFDLLVISGNTIPLSNSAVLDSGGSTDDFSIGKISRHFYAKSSSDSSRIWGKSFVLQLADAVESLVSHDGGDFVDAIEKVSKKQGVRLKVIDETDFSLKLETVGANQSVPTNTKMISWLPATDINLVTDRLQQLGMWIIDGDFSCKAVVCHQS
ncbi:uncharacterized protein LOC141619349 [Silene latifolia]|uniref:uncharacterized protein LOC141619349 n=1 Tax=Silene latifolia TaxID=37657 RepID=UPI003D7750B4